MGLSQHSFDHFRVPPFSSFFGRHSHAGEYFRYLSEREPLASQLPDGFNHLLLRHVGSGPSTTDFGPVTGLRDSTIVGPVRFSDRNTEPLQ